MKVRNIILILIVLTDFVTAQNNKSWKTTRYPDTNIVILDQRFEKYVVSNARIEKLLTGARWAEGPVWFGDGHYLYSATFRIIVFYDGRKKVEK